MMARVRTVDDLSPGQRGTIAELRCEGALRRRLLDLGLTPGCEVLLRKTAPFGDPLQLHLRGYELSLRRADARRIELARLPAVVERRSGGGENSHIP